MATTPPAQSPGRDTPAPPAVRWRRGPWLVAAAVVAMVLARPAVLRARVAARATGPGAAVVVRVVDGDTVVVRFGVDEETVRLLGVNTPETVKPGAPVECWGPEASKHTKALLPPGTPVRLQRDLEPRDRYGRLLDYIWRATDGRFINLDLVTGGWGQVMSITPNTAHAAHFAAAAASARAAGRGLWGACTGRGPPGGG